MLLDEIKRTIEAPNASYRAGYRDAKLELRRRLRLVDQASDAADQSCAIIKIVTEFIDA